MAQSGNADAALPLLEAGFAARELAVFTKPDDLILCALALGSLRDQMGNYDRALDAYAVALEIAERNRNENAAAVVLNNIAKVYRVQGNYTKALETYEQALVLWKQIGERTGQAITLDNMGLVFASLGRYTEAVDSHQQALTLFREVYDKTDEGVALNNLALAYAGQGSFVEALRAHQQALAILREVGDRRGEGITLDNLGQVYIHLRRYKDALASHQHALAILRDIGDQQDESIALNNLGEAYLSQGRYSEAFNTLQQALTKIRELGDRHGEITVLGNLSEAYQVQGHYGEALTMLKQAEAIAGAAGDRIGEGDVLSNKGSIYEAQELYEEALAAYQQALVIRREVRDQPGQIALLNNIGEIYRVEGQFREALEVFQQALSLAQAIPDAQSEGTTLNNIGQAYWEQGRYGDALVAHEQAMSILRKADDRSDEAATLNCLGVVYARKGQYAEALAAHQQALAIFKEVDDLVGEGATLGNIGWIYEVQGRYQDALDIQQSALALQRETGSRINEGATLNNIGLALTKQGRYQEALDAYQKALVIRREVSNRAGEAITLHNIGFIYQSQGRYQEALDTYQQALTIAQELGSRAQEGATLNNMGGIYDTQGQYDHALGAYQQALVIRQQSDDRLGEGITLNGIGFAYQQLGQANKALTYYTQAMDALEYVRAIAGSEQGRADFIAQYASLYDRAVVLYHQQGQDDLAFVTSERGRARAFLDSLATGMVQLSDQDASTLIQREQETYAAHQDAQNALAHAHAANPPDPALIADLERQLKAFEQQHTDALAAIEQRGGQLAALVPSRTKHVLDRPAVQRLLDSQTTLVAYVVGEDQTLAFILTRDNFQTVALTVRRADLFTQVRTLRAFPNTTDAYPNSARQLYDWLIVPLKAYLKTPHLAIVPHSVLHYLPFAALTNGTRFLIDDYTLTILPSASSLPFIRQNSGRTPAAPLILGNPITSNLHLPSLTHAEEEARTIAQLYGVVPLLGTQATAQALRERAAHAGIVHLAAHGIYSTTDSLASAIMLAPDGSDDGQLTVSAVYGLNLHAADLVVLSACETQLGTQSAGDEVVGLTRAFFFAGTPSVLATLWSVDDKATELLMERFYTHLHDGLGKAEALRQAQLDVRQDYPNPYYWAGFVLSGDGGAASAAAKSTRGALWLWLGASGLILLVAGFAGVILLRRRSKRAQSDTLPSHNEQIAPDLQSPIVSSEIHFQQATEYRTADPDLDVKTTIEPQNKE